MSLFDKIRNLRGNYNDDYDEYEDDYEEEYEEPKKQSYSSSQRNYTPQPLRSFNSPALRPANSKVVNINTNIEMEIIVTSIDSIEQAREVCEYLKNKKIIVANLEDVDFELAQRVTDFLSGACCAIKGSMQLISEKIFIVSPVNVGLTNQFNNFLLYPIYNCPKK